MGSYKKGLGFFDIIVIILIGGLTSGIVSFNYTSKVDTARDTKRMSETTEIRRSVERYLSMPENNNIAQKLYINKLSLSNVSKDLLGKHHILTLDVDQNFLEILKGLDLQKAPMDPLGKNYYRFGIAYTNNPYNMLNVAATLEYDNNKSQHNTYVVGSYKSGKFDDRKSLVSAYQPSYPAVIKSTGDYVYEGSTSPLIPYRLDD